ncbi:hypothetical protein [Streptomyces rubellomurinus]|uniref:Secreted protein n=1 Tax=Streptomyces rubellomurinus (strain ATCC 31215) TaxID=359131 RepID=A0A0F2TP94_STRR3|nr:hypothetical protein [Streptomyces rubellomurinus]KJS63542.1 hypothetical protein VM95_01290 [Streptomyces rubellomurinus]
MKRVLHAAGVALTAAALCLTTATSAGAAAGAIILNGQAIQDPSGCYNVPGWPAVVDNQTDQVVTVFGNDDCTGPVNGTVGPGEMGTFDFGASVFVP